MALFWWRRDRETISASELNRIARKLLHAKCKVRLAAVSSLRGPWVVSALEPLCNAVQEQELRLGKAAEALKENVRYQKRETRFSTLRFNASHGLLFAFDTQGFDARRQAVAQKLELVRRDYEREKAPADPRIEEFSQEFEVQEAMLAKLVEIVRIAGSDRQLLRVLTTEKNTEVKRRVISAIIDLGDLGEPANNHAAVALVQQLGDDKFHDLAKLALLKLGNCAIEPLLDGLVDTSGSYDPQIESISADRRAADVLFAIGPPAVSFLVGALMVAERRRNALHTLKRLKWNPSTPQERAAVAAAEGRYSDAASEGAVALSILASELRLMYVNHRELRKALESLGWKPSTVSEWLLWDWSAALPFLASNRSKLYATITDVSVRLRAAAARAIGEVGGEQRTDLIAQLIRDKDAEVRRSATTALGRVGGPESVGLLKAALKDKVVESAALSALGEIASEEAMDVLTKVLKGCDDLRMSDVYFRAEYTVEALEKTENAQAVQPLVDLVRRLHDLKRLQRGDREGKHFRRVLHSAITALEQLLMACSGTVGSHELKSLIRLPDQIACVFKTYNSHSTTWENNNYLADFRKVKELARQNIKRDRTKL